MSIALRGLTKTYTERARRHRRTDLPALDGIDLEVRDGELLVVVGPSGSGKTTLLRCVAGLEQPDAGSVEVGGQDVTDSSPGNRDVAMVFQEFALYPHLSVRDNVEFGLRARKVPGEERARLVTEAVEILGLHDILDRRPGELSGGEKQRVALGRAIVRKPKAFLLDEPLSNLDAELRAHTRAEIRRLQRVLGTTMLYVTHDQVEAMTMGDRVAILRAGRLEQLDRPMTIYERPANAFVARFLGNPPMNVFPSYLLADPQGASFAGLRPEKISVVSASDGRITGRVRAIEPVGNEAIVHLDSKGTVLLARVDPHFHIDLGAEVGLAFKSEDLHSFEGPDGRAIR